MSPTHDLILAGALPGAEGGLPAAAAVAVAIASAGDVAPIAGGDGAVVLVEAGAPARRGPTMLASEGARELERSLDGAGFRAAARGRLAWVALEGDASPESWAERLARCAGACSGARALVACLPVELWGALLARAEPAPVAALLRADLPEQRALTALAVRELHGRELRVRVAPRAPGRVSSRRALAGIDPGGEWRERSRRLAAGLLGRRRRRDTTTLAGGLGRGEGGQALPLVLALGLLLIVCALVLAVFGGAVSGKSRQQRLADLSALSGARAMRDDFARLFVAARGSDGLPNPAHLSKTEYLERARAAALEAAERNGAGEGRVEIRFPDKGSFAPLRVRVRVRGELDLAGDREGEPVVVHAEAEAVPGSQGAAAGTTGQASGGGYSGSLVLRQGEGMRPDVAAAYDGMAAAAASDGHPLIVNSAFRSDAEQAALFAANPDPRWVAPPGRSLHRCATELDLGPETAHGWLAENAPRFGFAQRYAWEPWHYGFIAGPPPCSAAGERVEAASSVAGGGSAASHGGDPGPAGAGSSADGDGSSSSLPSFVPARYRDAIALAAARRNVPAALLAAQLMAESNFNPFAVSPAGASGIAQFMPATAAAYGLEDPFDAEAAIDAQAHLMSDLLERFGGDVPLALAAYNAGPAPVAACSCVPGYPETQAYVARILGLIGGAGGLAAPSPTLEVRLVD